MMERLKRHWVEILDIQKGRIAAEIKVTVLLRQGKILGEGGMNLTPTEKPKKIIMKSLIS
jgi:hypothetical protein